MAKRRARHDARPNAERAIRLLDRQETNIAVWEHHTFNATAARVSAEACKPVQKELCAGWLPSRVFAENWLEFVRRPMSLAIWAP